MKSEKKHTLEIRDTTRGRVPRISFAKIARAILGNGYSLSLVICGDTLSQRLNKTYRKKGYKPNVLSFPLSKREGEIILNIRKAAREARSLGVSEREHIALLFIHGCLHLKGLDHSTKMDQLERTYLKKFA